MDLGIKPKQDIVSGVIFNEKYYERSANKKTCVYSWRFILQNKNMNMILDQP